MPIINVMIGAWFTVGSSDRVVALHLKTHEPLTPYKKEQERPPETPSQGTSYRGRNKY